MRLDKNFDEVNGRSIHFYADIYARLRCNNNLLQSYCFLLGLNEKIKHEAIRYTINSLKSFSNALDIPVYHFLDYFESNMGKTEIAKRLSEKYDMNMFKAFRYVYGLNAEEVADKLDISTHTVSIYERKLYNQHDSISLHQQKQDKTLNKFADLFRCHIQDLHNIQTVEDENIYDLSVVDENKSDLDNVIAIAKKNQLLMTKAWRIFRKKTIAQASKEINTHYGKIYAIEKFSLNISQQNKEILAKLYQCQPHHFDNSLINQEQEKNNNNFNKPSNHEIELLINFYAKFHKINKLKARRLIMNYSLKFIAEKTHSSRQNIQELENRINNEYINKKLNQIQNDKNHIIHKIANTYNCPIENLLIIK